jgi:acyl carrier protein
MLEKVIEFIQEYNNLQGVAITGETKLILDLGLSSFELVEMCCHMEEKLEMEISEEDMMQITTINDIVKYLEK